MRSLTRSTRPDLPDGTVSVLPGGAEIGEYLVAHPRDPEGDLHR